MTSANDEPKQPADTQDTADREDQPIDRKLTVIGQNTTDPAPPSEKDGEVIRDLVVPRPPDESSKSDDPRSPGIQDRDTKLPISPPQPEQEVVRKLVVPNETDVSDESDDPRSPGVQDRDVVIPPPPPKEIEEVEVIREIIIPRAQAEPEDEDADP